MGKTFGVSFISSYVPRQCGIATFTNDLATSFKKIENGASLHARITVLNDIPEGYKYPPEVKFEIKDKSINDYKEAAYYLNLSGNDIINLQHEFGFSPSVGNKTWLTIIEWVSIWHLANSWTNLSVSYNDKNSGIQRQINVVKFFKHKKPISYFH